MWIVSDYFVLETAQGVMAKSGHNYAQFQDYAQFQEGFARGDFVCEFDRDITDETLKTLEFAKDEDIVRRGALALTMLRQRINQRSKILAAIVNVILWLGRKEIHKLNDSRILIDAKAFATNKTYRIMCFRRS